MARWLRPAVPPNAQTRCSAPAAAAIGAATLASITWTECVAPVAAAALVDRNAGASAAPPALDVLTIRGHELKLRVYGTRGGPVAVVASGDGGWIHLGPSVAGHTPQPEAHVLPAADR